MSGSERGWHDQLASPERDGHVALAWVDDAVEWLATTHGGPAHHILTVGAGPGFAAYTLAERFTGAHVTALDPTPALLDRAARRATDRGTDDRFANHLSMLDDAVGALPPADLVWSSRAVHHLPDPVGGLRAIRTLLRPGGAPRSSRANCPARPARWLRGRPAQLPESSRGDPQRLLHPGVVTGR